METDSLASGSHFLPFSKIAVNRCQSKQFFLQLDHIFQANPSFRLVETSFLFTANIIFIPSFFSCLRKLLMKLGESLFLRTNHTRASGHLLFRFFQRFSKKKQFFRRVKTYFLISFIH